jgi:hypothetical protein
MDISDYAPEIIKIIAQVDARERYRACNSPQSGPRKIEHLPIQSNSVAGIETGES